MTDRVIGRRWAALRVAVERCRACPRLVQHRERVAREKRRQYQDVTYWGRPVPGFGDALARVLVVGLAPAAHGANRTGRMFTGDRSGDWLYDALHAAGFANRPRSVRRGDGLRLRDVRITAVVRCAPPGNLPTRAEMTRCRGYLHTEIGLLGPRLRVVVALGGVALRGFLDAWGELDLEVRRPRPVFRHGGVYRLPSGPWLLTSYHPSQQNTFTGRLTRRMLRDVFRRARRLLKACPGRRYGFGAGRCRGRLRAWPAGY